jgi:hypothetical protein
VLMLGGSRDLHTRYIFLGWASMDFTRYSGLWSLQAKMAPGLTVE